MDIHSPSPSEHLVQHLIMVGPGKGIVFNPQRLSSLNSSGSSTLTIHPSQPTILRSFPEPHPDHTHSVTSDVAYFCQPDGCSVELHEQRIHYFMLTDTETNQRTYGACLSFSHLFDPPREEDDSDSVFATCPVSSLDSVCIQEWGVLSLCVLSHHPFYVFLRKSLLSLHHFVEHFFGEDLTWNALIHRQSSQEGEQHRAVAEIQRWIAQLLSIQAPRQGQSALEVELEVDPAVTVAVPPANRLPLLDLCVSHLFQRLGVCCVIEIFKLVLAEQKVILYSEDVSFVSECVLIILSLLYPLQYLFPSIPLLPTSMPTAENLLMVPTPFFIGVHKSFLEKLGDVRHSEAWMINLDTRKFECPTCTDQLVIPEFPYSILQLQADIRKVLDYLDREGLLDWDEDHSIVSSYMSHTTGDDRHGSLRDEVDVMIRVAFVEFIFSPEILGCTEQYMCVYRLFTRPVVAIKTTAFIHGYQKSCPATNIEFIQNLIRSQGIEYFFEWSLNPSNSAFSEIRRGIHSVERLSDKQYHYIHKSGLTVHQVCLYTLSDDSKLYQEMLAYKASHASYYLVSSTDLPSEEDEDDESDWEILAATRQTNSLELPMSSPSSASDDHAPSFSMGGAYPMHQLLVTATTPDYEAERYLRDVGMTVGFLPHQVAEAEVHIPHLPPSNNEVVSTSVRVGGNPDDFDTPISSLVDPSPLANVAMDNLAVPVETASPVLTPGVSETPPPPHEKSEEEEEEEIITHTQHRSQRDPAVRVTSLVTDSLKLPPGPRRRIVISSASSSVTSSCEGDESGGVSDDSTDGLTLPWTNLHLLSSPLMRKRYAGSYEHLSTEAPPPNGGTTRAQSVSPTPLRGHPVYSEDDTVLVTLRKVDTQRNSQSRGSFFNLSPAPSMDVVEFTTPLLGPVSQPISNLSRSSSLRLPREHRHTSPYPLPASNNLHVPVATMSRTVPLSAITHTQALEFQIQELVNKLVDGQGLPLIKPPALRRMASYEKTRVMILRQLEHELGVRRPGELKMATDSQILPVGVAKPVYRGLLELLKYFLGYIDEELQKEPEASIFSVFLILRLAFSIYLLPKSSGKPRSPAPKSRLPTQPNPSPSFLPPISTAISPGSLPRGKTIAVSNSPQRSPVMQRKAVPNHRSNDNDDSEVTPQHTPVKVGRRREGGGGDGGGGDGGGGGGGGGEIDNSQEGSDITPTPKAANDNKNNSSLPYFIPSSIATPPNSRKIPNSTSSNSHSGSGDPQFRSNPRDGRRPPHKPGSPLVAMHKRLRSEADLNKLGTVPTYDKDTAFLYKDLTKSLGVGGKAFMMESSFWSILYMSVVTMERSYLGWNENTADLYQRYNSLSETHRLRFGADEDYLLSLILHNLLVYMLALGKTAMETTDIIHRLTARTRLATIEEKQLQKTLRLVENNSPNELDLSDLGLMSLYSEVHPTVYYIVHYGINMIAPVYKLQITNECLILRRFPDEKISMRLWNDQITAISNNDRRATVTILYLDGSSENRHHFHSKEFLKVYESLQILVSVGTILS